LNDEEIEDEICKYIRAHPGTTINKVADHLTKNKKLSYVTTYKKVKLLIKVGIIEDRKEGNSFHRLFVDEKNDFNRIDKQLIETEKFLNNMGEVIRKIDLESIDSPDLDDSATFVQKYDYLLSKTLGILLANTTLIKSEKHRQILYNRIAMLMFKLDIQMKRNDLGPFSTYRAYEVEELFIGPLKSYLEKKGVYAKSHKNLITLFETFRQNILHID
jgi:predicted transcriptional regulator